MRRREFIVLAAGAAVAWPLAARAQQPTMPVIGFLSNSSRQLDALRLGAVWQGLKEAGYVEGRNVASEYRGAEDRYELLQMLAADLARQQPAVIVTLGGPTSAVAAKAASTTVPVVFTVAGDPVKLGLVASFNRPGGNLTGVMTLTHIVVAKQFEAIHEMRPDARLVGCLVNPNNPNTESDTKEAHAAARGRGLQLQLLQAANEAEIDAAFAVLAQRRADALVVVADAFFNSRADQFAALAARHSLPAIYSLAEFARAGGLMSYGTVLAEAYRQAGIQAGRVLKGEKPADLPIFQATKVELVINLKAAKALGLTFPMTLLGRADEVIE
jgi:putative tryptophan/tyrosine transport system substrate-binding protein